METGKLLPSIVLAAGLTMAEAPARAAHPLWTPAVGTLTTAQDTDIRMLSQELKLEELQEVAIGDVKVWAMETEAKFVLKNSSRAKKKPTVMFPLCRTDGPLDRNAICNFKKMSLKIKVDGKTVDTDNLVKQDDVVFVRFPIKFGPRSKKEVEVSFRHFESAMESRLRGDTRPFAQFDYSLTGGVRWEGKVGVTRARIKVPYKADKFNTRLLSSRGKFERDTAFASWKSKPFDPEPGERFSFAVITPAFKYKTDQLKKKLKKTPGSAKRNLAMAGLLAAYTPAKQETTNHVATALGTKLKKWPDEKRDAAAKAFAELIVHQHLSYAPDVERECDQRICDQREAFADINPLYCQSDPVCLAALDAVIKRCCGDEAPAVVKDEPKDIEATPPAPALSPVKVGKQPEPSSLEKNAFVVLVSFIALVWIVAGIMIVITLRRHRRS
jgi:hypothetical protein